MRSAEKIRPEHHASQAGFTLLELLLVVAILSSLALAATAFVDTKDNQERFEITRERLADIRHAAIGQPHLSVGGETVVGGFVADMGRLPNNLEELLSQPPDCDPVTEVSDLCPWGFDETSGIWRGWRGPYLNIMPSSDGNRKFLDGWGNAWGRFVVDTNGGLLVQSDGADGKPNPFDSGQYAAQTDYEKDFPRSPSANPDQPPEPLITSEDYELMLTDEEGKGGLTVNLLKPYGGACTGSDSNLENIQKKEACEAAGGTWTFNTYALCLRLYYRKHGVITILDTDNDGTINVTKDGSHEVMTFKFPNNTTVPLGMASVEVREGDTATSNSCSGNIKSPNASRLPILFVPRSVLPFISIQLVS